MVKILREQKYFLTLKKKRKKKKKNRKNFKNRYNSTIFLL